MLPKDFESTVHVSIRVVSAISFFFWQLLHPLLQEVILCIEDDSELRNNFIVDAEAVFV